MVREILTVTSLALCFLLTGCANLGKALSQEGEYDFRKTRWGFTQDRVMLTEQGKRIHLKKGNVVIYNHSIGDIKCKIVYCFKDNQLRAAGYITDKPVKTAKDLVKLSVDELGEPTQIINSGGMLWITDDTLVYSNAYLSRFVERVTEYRRDEGILSTLLRQQNSEDAGVIARWDGVWAYIDQDFYKELHEERFPLDELSFHEKLLFGVLKRRTIYTYYSRYATGLRLR